MKQMLILAATLFLISGGCASPRYGQSGRDQYEDPDTVRYHRMTAEDVIALVKGGVGDDVIMHQMRATHSSFDLSSDDIVSLKKEGVSEKVINAMIGRSGEPGDARDGGRYNDYPPYPGYYPYPWFSSVYLGFGYPFYRPHYFYRPPFGFGFRLHHPFRHVRPFRFRR